MSADAKDCIKALTRILLTECPYLDPSVRAQLVNKFAAEIGAATQAPAQRDILHNLKVTQLIEYMAHTAGFTVAQVRGRSQKADIAHCRAETCWILHRLHGLGPVKIGQIMSRDHTTITHALKKLADRREEGHWSPPLIPDHLKQGSDYD